MGLDEKGKLPLLLLLFLFSAYFESRGERTHPSRGNNRGRGGGKGKQPEIEESEIRLILKKENERKCVRQTLYR